MLEKAEKILKDLQKSIKSELMKKKPDAEIKIPDTLKPSDLEKKL